MCSCFSPILEDFQTPRLLKVVKYTGQPWPERISASEIDDGVNLFQAEIGDPPLLEKGRIRAGEAFGVRVEVLYLLFDAS